MNIDFTVKKIAKIFNGRIIGDNEVTIKGIGTIENANKGDITFLSNAKYIDYLDKTNASAVIIDNSLTIPKKYKPTLIKVTNAYESFAILLTEINKANILVRKGIEKPSYISKNSKINKNCYVGAFSYIDENVVLNEKVKIFPNCYVGKNTSIGSNTIIYSGVKIYPNTVIGNNCTIHSNSVIGSDGFGFAPQENEEFITIPQIGNVIIKDNVSIGSNTVIDKATIESTIINKGVKLDNLIQIGHNVEIGKNTVIAAQSGISGSTKVGKNSMLGGQVGVVGHLKLGDFSKYAAQAGVSKNTKNNQTVIGSPAMPKDQFIKSYIIFKKLPSIVRQIEELEKKLSNLQAK